jgi:hypothetical protein
MRTARRNREPVFGLLALRPALTEAKLMTEKHACDAIYVATLAEELRRIEAEIARAEQMLHLAPADHPGCTPAATPSVGWFREKSAELDLRLRRIEQADQRTESKQGVAFRRPANIAFA